MSSQAISPQLIQLIEAMANVPPGPPTKPSLVNESVFVGVLWGGMVISFLFIAARLLIRLKTFGQLWLDDLFVVIGWLLIFTSTIVWHFAEHAMFLSTEIETGQLSPLNYPDYIPATEHYLRSTVAIIILFYSSLAAIKVSFLLFFRRLLNGVHVKGLTIQWWVVLAITIITWIASIADIEYQCLAPDFIKIATTCTQQWSIHFQRITLAVNCVMDVVTDAMIVTIPVAVLWNVRITTKRRLALSGLFGLTIVTMTFAIVRVAVVLSASDQADVSWLYLWSAIEPPVAVIVACLVSFRALFGQTEIKTRRTGRYFSSTGNSSLINNTWRRLISINQNGSNATRSMPEKHGQSSTKIPLEVYKTTFDRAVWESCPE